MTAFDEHRIGRLLGDRYRLVAPVGSGASATVYLAEDIQLARRVAVKLLHPSLADDPAFLRRFRAEAQAAAALSHPNVLAVFDWGQHGGPTGTPYLVLEFLPGGSLRSMLDRGRLLSPSQALVVGLEAARGLDYAHRRGLVHRDIKPANLLFGDDGRLRIADFGLARAIAEAAWTEPAGVVLGTARYASPEQARGQAVDGKTDVYSLALSLVEAVTGQVPFAAETTVATLMNRLDKLLPVSADLGPLAPVLERAGRPDAAERFDAGELAAMFVQTAERLPRPAPLPLVTSSFAPDRPDSTDVIGSTAVGVPVVTVAGGAFGRADEDQSAFAPAGRASVFSPATVELPAIAPARRPSDAAPGTDDLVSVHGRSDADGTVHGASLAAGPTTVLVGPTPATANSGRAGRAASRADKAAGTARADDTPPPRGPAARAPKVDPVARQASKRVIRRAVLIIVGLIVAGALAVTLLFLPGRKPRSFPVPPLTGLTYTNAENVVSQNRWTIVLKRQKDQTIPLDQVISTDPSSGELRQGGQFTLVVSDGPPPVALPELTNKNKTDATVALAAAGLTLNVTGDAYDEVVPPGTILSWTVAGQTLAAGTEVMHGAVVDAVLSKGPAPRVVPEVRKMTFDQAKAALEAAGLKVERQDDQFSDKWDPGLVTFISPEIGATVPRDTVVKIAISKGPDLVVVPDLKGMTLDQAKAKLAEARLALGQTAGPATKNVVSQSPAAGESIKAGSAINLLLG